MQGGNSPSSYVAQWSYGRCGGWVHGRMHLYLHYILYIVPHLGAYRSQLGGTYLYFCCCFIRSLTTVIIHLYIYIYIYIIVFILRVNFLVCFCTSDAFHNKIRNDSSLQVCYSYWLRHDGMSPSGNGSLAERLILRLDLRIHTFELVIRLSKVKQSFTFQLFTLSRSMCWTIAHCAGESPFCDWQWYA